MKKLTLYCLCVMRDSCLWLRRVALSVCRNMRFFLMMVEVEVHCGNICYQCFEIGMSAA